MPLLLAWAALVGLGVVRQADPLALVTASVLLVLGPGLMVAWASPQRPLRRGALAGVFWGAGLLLALPVWFPGERADALATGLGTLGFGESGARLARNLEEPLPQVQSEPPAPAAEVLASWTPPPSGRAELEGYQIALPYEGEGRRLSVPLMLEHGDRVLEDVQMMLDTGATYTTLPEAVLRKLGIRVTKDAPTIQLQTANGKRTAQLVRLDRLWLGDLDVDNVTIAVCEACASDHAVGLLGLNVTGGFNTTIDADFREVVLSRRVSHDRRLDITPFVDVGAQLSRFPGGRVQVEVEVDDLSDVDIHEVVAGITCGDTVFAVPVGPIEAGSSASDVRGLPAHDACEEYKVTVESAYWTAPE